MKAGNPSVPSIKSYLKDRLPRDSRISIDPFVHSVAFVNDLEEVFVARHHWHILTLQNTVWHHLTSKLQWRQSLGT